MASIAEHRLQNRNSFDVAISAIGVLLGLGGILVFYYGYPGFSTIALTAATVMLTAALAIAVQGYRRGKEESSDSGAMVRSIVEALPHPVVIRNAEGNVIFFNAAAHCLLQQHRAAPSEPPDPSSRFVKSAVTLAEGGVVSSSPALSDMKRLPWRSSKGNLLGWVEMPAGADRGHSPSTVMSDPDLEKMVAQRTQEVRELVAHIETCREEEKKTIARRLHGDLGSSLTALSMHLAILSRQVADQPAAQARLQQMKELLSAAHDTARRVQSSLRPDKLDLFGMKAAVEDLADSLSQSTGIACNLYFPDDMPAYPAHVEIALYRMLEEALRNVARHAYATQVDISFEEKDGSLTLSVRDNGVGFSLHELPADTHGLRGLRERTAYLGGRAVIQSVTGEGSCISFILPALRQPSPLPQAS